MKFRFFFVLLLCFCKLSKAQNIVEVYLLAGQSNATGQGYMANLDANLIVPKDVWLYHSGKPHLQGKNEAYTWAPLAQASESIDRFGPELGIGFQLRQLKPKTKIAIIKHAHSGTNLYQDWYPGISSKDSLNFGKQYKEFVYTVETGLAALKAKGFQPVLKGVFWQQGESDADKMENAKNYEKNLKHFIERVREQFNIPNLPFVYGYVLPPPNNYIGRDVLRTAQKNISLDTAIQNVYLVETDDLSRRAKDRNTQYPNDYLHFGTQGTWDLGVRMVDSLVQ